MLSQILLLADREKSVAVYSDHRAVCLYGSERLLYTASAASGVVAVDRVAQIIIRICVETVGKLLSLVSLVRTGSVCKKAVLVSFLLSGIVALIASV